MASPNPFRIHLDATTEREVVYCHACSAEWHRDEYGLECPHCQSDATEIIAPDNDPRSPHHSSASTSPEIPPFRRDDRRAEDSDPDEADIDEHMGANGFVYRRSTRSGQGPEDRHHDPAVEPVLERFVGMLQGFGMSVPPHGAAADPSGMRRGAPTGMFHAGGAAAPPVRGVHRTTFVSGGPGRGTTSVTIVSGSGPSRLGGGFPGFDDRDQFQTIFADVLRDVGPPGGDEHGGASPPGFARSLQDILSLFNPANAMAGDAVYSQEALDRIITNLMEANPQSNAAPPASEEALTKLERRPVDKAMLTDGEKTECAICIDEMKEGDMAAFLPCKHWFHEECVVLWLKEHNTCPVCRTPIEKRDRDSADNGGSGNGPEGSRSTRGPGPAFPPPPENSGASRGSHFFTTVTPDFGGGAPGSGGDAGSRWGRSSRPPTQRQSRLNEALRSVSYTQREMEREQQRQRDRASASASSAAYDTSRLQRRRSSHSPTSPRATAAADQGSRMRERSPSGGGRRGSTYGETTRQSGQGPLGWLRDRFSGGGGASSSRDGRRS